VGVKCGRTRDEADEWLHRYPDDATVMAYIGRSGWNTLRLRGAIPDEELLEAVDASYDTVVAKLPRKERPAP
jgi:predicted DNA-binding protein (MmcQ/YjbR family)